MQLHLATHIDRLLVSCFSNSSSISWPRYFLLASLFPLRITILIVSIVPMLHGALKNITRFIYDCPWTTNNPRHRSW